MSNASIDMSELCERNRLNKKEQFLASWKKADAYGKLKLIQSSIGKDYDIIAKYKFGNHDYIINREEKELVIGQKLLGDKAGEKMYGIIQEVLEPSIKAKIEPDFEF